MSIELLLGSCASCSKWRCHIRNWIDVYLHTRAWSCDIKLSFAGRFPPTQPQSTATNSASFTTCTSSSQYKFWTVHEWPIVEWTENKKWKKLRRSEEYLFWRFTFVEFQAKFTLAKTSCLFLTSIKTVSSGNANKIRSEFYCQDSTFKDAWGGVGREALPVESDLYLLMSC